MDWLFVLILIRNHYWNFFHAARFKQKCSFGQIVPSILNGVWSLNLAYIILGPPSGMVLLSSPNMYRKERNDKSYFHLPN